MRKAAAFDAAMQPIIREIGTAAESWRDVGYD